MVGVDSDQFVDDISEASASSFRLKGSEKKGFECEFRDHGTVTMSFFYSACLKPANSQETDVLEVNAISVFATDCPKFR